MAKSQTTTSAPLVLVADDTVPTTTMLQRVFEYEGYRVHCVHDGVTALESARTMLPDLILLDINMPGMNGFEVLKHLRDDPATVTIPTILITALGELSDIVQGLQLGADDYVRKPFHWRELLARAQSKMRARKLEEALQRRTEDLEALLRVSEELNQHLEVDEILELILHLSQELIGAGGAVIYLLDGTGKISGVKRHQTKALLDDHGLVSRVLSNNQPFIWGEGDAFSPEFPYGIVTPLQYDEQNRLQSILVLVNQNPWDSNHLQLVTGIARQASMALRNAELYHIKANYALHLEDMVEERTHELRSAQQMLIRSEKLASIGRLAASIAHEINNPLLPIQINLDDMLEDLEAKKSIDPEEIRRTQESVERIRRIVNRLLEFTGHSHITASDNHKPLDLNKIIQNVTELVRKSFEQKGQKIELDLTPVPKILGDKDGLEQVFMNMALNASEAMGRNGVLKISNVIRDDMVVTTVADNGTGIPSEIIEKMFEPFVSTKEDGNGLGLFVSYGIIQSHNGTIEVSSKVNHGTTFTIKLPLSPESMAQGEKASGGGKPARSTRKRERSR
jgi:signal transduction histidine kinase